jgi:hypothetical protein
MPRVICTSRTQAFSKAYAKASAGSAALFGHRFRSGRRLTIAALRKRSLFETAATAGTISPSAPVTSRNRLHKRRAEDDRPSGRSGWRTALRLDAHCISRLSDDARVIGKITFYRKPMGTEHAKRARRTEFVIDEPESVALAFGSRYRHRANRERAPTRSTLTRNAGEVESPNQ